jgi:peptide/nickel transport system permease protein
MAENSSGTSPTYAAQEGRRKRLLSDLLSRLVKEKPLGLVGGIIVLLLLITGVFADFLAPYGFNDIHLADRLTGPSTTYILGTDNLGRDMLSRIIFGARISMYVGLGAALISTVEASVIGIVSGYLGGKFDILVQRFVDAWMAFPFLFILLTVMAIIGGGTLQVTVVLGMASGIGGSRVVRSAVIAIKGNVYVEAARAIGTPTTRILTRHVLPNVMAPIIVMFSIGIGGMILAEASLSFLGFGIVPPTPSWGGMLSGSGRTHMIRAPWMMIWPGAALATVVYGLNMFGDAVRDLLDPRLRGGLGRYGRAKALQVKEE